MPQRTRSITARVLVEPGSESLERTMGYVISALKTACRNIRDGTVAIALYDENDRLIGMDLSGVPSEGLQVTVDDMFEDHEGS